jgi:hypothetical protein
MESVPAKIHFMLKLVQLNALNVIQNAKFVTDLLSTIALNVIAVISEFCPREVAFVMIPTTRIHHNLCVKVDFISYKECHNTCLKCTGPTSDECTECK